MSDVRRANSVLQERIVIGFDHGALTAGLGAKIHKAARRMRITRAQYVNPAGLVEHADNWFTVGLRRNGAADALVVADDVFTAEADDEKLTAVAHGLQTGDGPFQISNSGGALPAGLVAATDYWIIRFDADVFYLAASLALAFAGTNLTFTTDGTGTHTISDTANTRRPSVVASGVDTDSDGAGSNTLAADTFVDLTLVSTTLAAGDELLFVATEGGTATLPAGRTVVEALYVE